MPEFVLNTNLPVDKFKEECKGESFLTKTSKFVADLLGKPESYVCVRVNAGQLMTFGGSTDPCAKVDLYSIGKVGGEKNRPLVPAITKHLNDCGLDIAADRMYIHIHDVARCDLGWNRTTFG